MSLEPGSPAAAVFATLDSDDLVEASAALGTLLREGMPMAQVIDDVLSPVIAEVGLRWEANQWTIAQEHGATAMVDAALAAVEGRFPAVRSTEQPLVVACAEGEWHTLAARLAAARLRAGGHNVVFLGPSLPPDHLSAYLRRIGASALGLSCTIAANLIGARRCVEAAHRVGVPVVVGGAAFDPAGLRAESIGADSFHGASGSAAFLDAPLLLGGGEGRVTIRNRQEALDVEIALEMLVDAAMAELVLRYPPMAQRSRDEIAQARAMLSWTIKFGAASIDVADPTVFSQYLQWTGRMLAGRDVPEPIVDLLLDCVEQVLRSRFPRTARLIHDARREDRVPSPELRV